jgi:hypothetical protein
MNGRRARRSMAGGPTFVGIAAFAAVKLAGYSAAGAWLRRRYTAPRPRPIVFGLARTVLGIVVGVSFALAMESLGVVRGMVSYYLLLLPVRLAEWLAILWVFYRRAQPERGRRWRHATLGSAWSYLLDLPAIFAAFAVPGGMWIC